MATAMDALNIIDDRKAKLEQAGNPIGYAIKKGLGVLLKNMPENASAYGDVAMESNPDWAQRYSVAGGVAPRVIPTMATPSGNIPTPTNAVVAPPNGTVLSPAVTKQNAPEDGMNMIYGKLAKLNDKQFKQFADEHHGLPGVGYIQGADGKMVRSIENPANKPQVQEPMNIAQYHAQTERIKGVGAMKQAEAYQEAVIQNKKDTLEEKKVTDFEKTLLATAPKKYNSESGKYEEPLFGVALVDAIDKGAKYNSFPGQQNKDMANQLFQQREQTFTDYAKAFKQEYITKDAYKPGTKTYTLRQRLIKEWHDLQIGKPEPEKK